MAAVEQAPSAAEQQKAPARAASPAEGGGGLFQRLKDTIGLGGGGEEAEAGSRGAAEEPAMPVTAEGEKAGALPSGARPTGGEAEEGERLAPAAPRESRPGEQPAGQVSPAGAVAVPAGQTSPAGTAAAPAGSSTVLVKPSPPPGAGVKPAETVLADLDLASQVAQRAQQRAQRVAAAGAGAGAGAEVAGPGAEVAGTPAAYPAGVPAAVEPAGEAAGPGTLEAPAEPGTPAPALKLAAAPTQQAPSRPSPPAGATPAAAGGMWSQQTGGSGGDAAPAVLPLDELRAAQAAGGVSATGAQPEQHCWQQQQEQQEQQEELDGTTRLFAEGVYPREAILSPPSSHPMLLSPLTLPIEPAAHNPPTHPFSHGSAPMPLAAAASASPAAAAAPAGAGITAPTGAVGLGAAGAGASPLTAVTGGTTAGTAGTVGAAQTAPMMRPVVPTAAAPLTAAGPPTASVAPPAAGAMGTGVHPTAEAAARLEGIGARPGRISEGPASTGGAADGEVVEALPEAKQGERIGVQRLAAGPLAAGSRGPGAIQEVEVRPTHEVAPMSASDVAAMKAQEFSIQAEEQQRTAQASQEEELRLKQQAEFLEMQSQGLLAEASREKMRRDATLSRKQAVEQEEWRGYVQAEHAEAQRREVVMAARPAAAEAEESEYEALRVRQLAADTQFHAEVLERRATALMSESTDMAQLAYERELDAENLAAALMVKRQEQEEWQQKVDFVSAGDLPHYIEACEAEMGRLAQRMAELREEVDWAHLEMERLHAEGATWERVLQIKKSEAALLLLRMEQARQDAEEARQRSSQAAAESLEPNELALVKYEEAKVLEKEANELEAVAKAAQEKVLDVVRQAVGPEQIRQEHLRQAAVAEQEAMRLEEQAQLLQGKMERRLAEAETHAETATVLATRAVRAQEAGRAAEMTAQAQREMADVEAESQERLAEQQAAMHARMRARPPTEEIGEAMRRQREQYSTPEVTVLPTVPVEAPAVPLTPVQLGSHEVAAMLAEAPTPPTHEVATTAPPAEGRAEEQGAQPVAA